MERMESRARTNLFENLLESINDFVLIFRLTNALLDTNDAMVQKMSKASR